MMHRNLLILAMAMATVALQTSCVKQRGCTDVNADNYDPEAEQDDDTCVPTRLKFVGEYDAYGTIHNGDQNLAPFENVGLNVEDSTAFGPKDLIIGISNFDAQLYALRAIVTGTYDLQIDRQSIGDYTYWGVGNVNGRVLELEMTRLEKIEVSPDVFENDTLYLSLYGIKDIEP
jgi:hypothetical protein